MTDVYATEVAQGGDACIGHIGHDHSDDAHSHAASSTSAATAASTPATFASASADVPAPPAESTGCVLHVDHYHCEGPASATSAAAAAQQTGDCHTHADGGKHCVP
jgi:zinc transporter 1/2/3